MMTMHLWTGLLEVVLKQGSERYIDPLLSPRRKVSKSMWTLLSVSSLK